MKLLLLPGAGCGKGFYTNVEKDMSKYFNVEIYPCDRDTMEENVDKLIEKMLGEKEKFILFAHCYSGVIAVRALSKVKVRNLQGFVLCNSVANFTIIDREFISQDNGEHDIDYINDNVNIDKVLEAKKYVLPREQLENQLKMALSSNVTKYLKDLYMPVLVLYSDKDGYFPVEAYKLTIEGIPNVSSVLVPKARHLGLLTHTEEYLEGLNNWVKTLSLKLSEVF